MGMAMQHWLFENALLHKHCIPLLLSPGLRHNIAVSLWSLPPLAYTCMHAHQHVATKQNVGVSKSMLCSLRPQRLKRRQLPSKLLLMTMMGSASTTMPRYITSDVNANPAGVCG